LRKNNKNWKEGLETKRIEGNVGKTKIMRCEVDFDAVEDTGKYPCDKCKKG